MIGLIGQFGTRALSLVAVVIKDDQGHVQTPSLSMEVLIVSVMMPNNKTVIHIIAQVSELVVEQKNLKLY